MNYLVMPWSGSEPWFEPELFRTGPKSGSRFGNGPEPDLRSSSRFGAGRTFENRSGPVRTRTANGHGSTTFFTLSSSVSLTIHALAHWLTTGQGNRFVLASTQELHEKITELCARVPFRQPLPNLGWSRLRLFPQLRHPCSFPALPGLTKIPLPLPRLTNISVSHRARRGARFAHVPATWSEAVI